MSSSSRYIFALVFILWREGTCDVSITTHHADAPDGPEGPRNTHTTSMKRFKMKNSHVESITDCNNNEAITEGSGFPFELKRCLEITDCLMITLKNEYQISKEEHDAKGWIFNLLPEGTNYTRKVKLINGHQSARICKISFYYDAYRLVNESKKNKVPIITNVAKTFPFGAAANNATSKAPFEKKRMAAKDIKSFGTCPWAQKGIEDRRFPFSLPECLNVPRETCTKVYFSNAYLIDKVNTIPGWSIYIDVDSTGFSESMDIANEKDALICDLEVLYDELRPAGSGPKAPNVVKRIHIVDYVKSTYAPSTEKPLQEESTNHLPIIVGAIIFIVMLFCCMCFCCSKKSKKGNAPRKTIKEEMGSKKSIKIETVPQAEEVTEQKNGKIAKGKKK